MTEDPNVVVLPSATQVFVNTVCFIGYGVIVAAFIWLVVYSVVSTRHRRLEAEGARPSHPIAPPWRFTQWRNW